MKLQILKEGQDVIEGYHQIYVKDQQVDFEGISDNECLEIIANDIIDEFSIPNIGAMLGAVAKKLRLGGTLVAGGTDLRLYCHAVLDGTISEAQAGSLIEHKKSLSCTEIMLNTLRQMGFSVEVYDTMGVHFEITVRRVK